MERRAEINRFAIFLFCLLVPLGSLAPTEISESYNFLTIAERQKRFTTDIPYLSTALKVKARDLFEFYNNCISATYYPDPEEIGFEFKDMMEKTLACPAFQANCCVLHDIHNMLKSLETHMATFCQKSPTDIITSNLEQLSTTVRDGTAFYTCKAKEQPQELTMGKADKKTYIWWFLKRYRDITQNAVKLSSG